MENASKALLMAGGILLTIITLSLFIYLTTATSRIGEAQEAKTLTEQITAFNKEYEAYNKRRLYGTDVITVVNKAINHNEKMNAIEIEDPYYINVKIVPNQEYETTVIKVDNTKPSYTSVELKGTQITDDIKSLLKNPGNSYDKHLEADNEYTLGDWQSNGKSFVMNNDFIQFFEGDTEDRTETTPDGKTTYIMYSALTNFKRAIFTCNGTDYNEKTGRIDSITFTQL